VLVHDVVPAAERDRPRVSASPFGVDLASSDVRPARLRTLRWAAGVDIGA